MNPANDLINELSASSNAYEASWGQQMAQANKYDLGDGKYLMPKVISHCAETKQELFTDHHRRSGGREYVSGPGALGDECPRRTFGPGDLYGDRLGGPTGAALANQ